MWEIVIKILVCTMLSTVGGIVISDLFNIKLVFSLKNIVLLIVSSTILSALHTVSYHVYVPIISCLIMTYFYMYIFNINYKKSVIFTMVLMIVTLFCDLIISNIIMNFVSVAKMRSDISWIIIGNVSICLFLIIIGKCIKISRLSIRGKKLLDKNKISVSIVFILMLLMSLSIILMLISANYTFNYKHLLNLLLMIIFFIIAYIYILEIVKYDGLSKQYDMLLDCIQTFEDWIDKEQLNIHESKNQLVTLRSMIKNKKAFQYLNAIIDEKIIIESNWIEILKSIPNGGLKGLLYYKLSQSKKKDIKIELSVDSTVKKMFAGLTVIATKELCQLIGIYFDNALEEAVLTDLKVISLEIYSSDNNIIILLSNTCIDNTLFKSIDKKGYSSKGLGRGNGLYFASQIIARNKDIFKQERSIINNVYIQKLIICPSISIKVDKKASVN